MQMVASDSSNFPLVDLRAVSNSAHQWVALSARLGPPHAGRPVAADAADPPADAAASPSPWQAMFDGGALLAAIAPLDCIVHLDDSRALAAPLLARLPPSRVQFALAASALAHEGEAARLGHLQQAGYRILIDGGAAAGSLPLPATLRAYAHDGATALDPAVPLIGLFGPHLAHGVDDAASFEACAKAGFAWFSGHYPLGAVGAAAAQNGDGSSGRRLLKLLGLLLADAETREIETQLKQDPALCYHLLRLVNSAAFAAATPIHDFAQAIDRLGRRQLMRWLQLLLYARPREDGLANPLLPLAALRAAQIESLCKQQGHGREVQDLGFQVGVFSLLDVLLGMPMADIVDSLCLPDPSAAALLERGGAMGALLALAEAQAPSPAALDGARVTPQQWWHSQLHGFHWAIQVSRNL